MAELQRLSEPEKASFLVWFEGRDETLAISPAMEHGAESSRRLNLRQILDRLA